MANTTVACTNINLLKESQIPASPSQTELYAVELAGKPATEAELTGKANTNADNFTTTGKETIVGWGIPDYTAGVTKSLDTNYIAERSGEIRFSFFSYQYGGYVLTVDGNNTLFKTSNGADMGFAYTSQGYSTGVAYVKKGSSWMLTANSGTKDELRLVFYPFFGG